MAHFKKKTISGFELQTPYCVHFIQFNSPSYIFWLTLFWHLFFSMETVIVTWLFARIQCDQNWQIFATLAKSEKFVAIFRRFI